MIGSEGKMKLVYGHIGALFGDILSFLFIYLFFYQYAEITAALDSQADVVDYISGFYVLLWALFWLLFHLFALIRDLLVPKIKKFEGKFLIVVVIIALVSGFTGSYHINNKLGNSGYIKCPYANHSWRITTYTRTMDICKERREALRN